MKRIIAFVLSFVMAFGISFTVFASTTTPVTGYNLTINNLTGVTEINMYNLVKMEKEDGKIKYTLNQPKYNDIFTELGVTTVKQLSSKDSKTVLAAVQKKLGASMPDQTVSATGSEAAKVINDAAGYYYITMSGDDGTVYNPILVLVPETENDTYKNVTVNAKSNKPGITKTVKENMSYGKKSNADIGDVVDFKVEIDVPKYASHVEDNTVKLQVTDKMSKGLTWLDNQAVTVTDGVTPIAGALKTGSPVVVRGLSDTTITFDIDYSKVKGKNKVVLEYKALLNENAVIGTADNNNAAKLTYTTNPFTTTEFTTAEDKTFVYSYGLDLTKAELGHKDIVLKGAEFELSKDGNGKYYFIEKTDYYIALSSDKYNFVPEGGTFKAVPKVASDGLTELTGLKDKVISSDSGKIIIKGLDAGTYTLTETKAPDGYYKVRESIEFEIKDESTADISGKVATGGETGNEAATADAYYHKTIFNSTNYVLPLTGDNGALVIIVSGVVMLLAACSLFWIIRKKSADK